MATCTAQIWRPSNSIVCTSFALGSTKVRFGQSPKQGWIAWIQLISFFVPKNIFLGSWSLPGRCVLNKWSNKARCPQCLLQVREYEHDPEHQQESKAASEGLRTDAQAKRSQLEEWSATAYGEVDFTFMLTLTLSVCACIQSVPDLECRLTCMIYACCFSAE